MDPEAPPGGGGGLMGSKIMGIPTIVWVGGVALIVYFLFFRNSSGSASGVSTSGGGGTATSGNTTIDKGAIQVSITQGNSHQPKPPVRGRRPGHHSHLPGGLNPGGLNKPYPPRGKHPHKKRDILPTEHRPPSKRPHPGEIKRHKKKPVIEN